ncbi:MAG: septum formation protein Maf [Gemmatimonadetes bacterium]|nr:septum formation protein Maf [Gemmatimonadota bacterium]
MLGIPHEIDPAEVDETPHEGESAEHLAVRLAREKASAVALLHPGQWVLGADTVVVLDQGILGKPASPTEAEAMLGILAGREHRVVTAVALVRDGVAHEARDVTTVRFRSLTPELIRAYVSTGEPLDKAGAYGVQGAGAALVERIEGDFFGVMGLPLRLVVQLLERVGMPYNFTR